MSEAQPIADISSFPLFEAMTRHDTKIRDSASTSGPAGAPADAVQPLTAVEEAMLIATSGVTGITMPDMPFQSETGKDLLGTPMLHLRGRSASSADNAQSTHFFLVNDSGTYLLKHAPEEMPPLSFHDISESQLIRRAEACKIRVLDKRLEFRQNFPSDMGRQHHLSNVGGSTILVPVVDMTRQYINGMMYLLSQPAGYRPTYIDDWNFYRPAGVRKWIKSGYLNPKIRIPLGYTATFRIHVEASLLIQNMLLTMQAMGLDGWAGTSFPPSVLLGAPDAVKKFGPGLGFRFEEPRSSWFRRRVRNVFTPLPAGCPNPVGLDGHLEGACPPYYPTIDAAIDSIIAQKYGLDGRYSAEREFADIFKPGLAGKFVEEAPHLTDEAIDCTRDICNYLYNTYGRFPAHVDAIFVPGVWIQAHRPAPA